MEQEVMSFKEVVSDMTEEASHVQKLIQELIRIENEYNARHVEHPIALFIDFRH